MPIKKARAESTKEKEFLVRLSMYQLLLNKYIYDGNPHAEERKKAGPREPASFLQSVIRKESTVEKRIFSGLKQWEERHPLSAFLLLAVLGAVFLELLSGFLLEAAIMYFMR